MHVLIRKAKIIDPQSNFNNKVVDLLIEDGVIKSIGSNIDSTPGTVIEGVGIHISPGWVDVFADYCEPGYEQKETIATGLKAAAAGGFTDMLLSPNTNPPASNKGAVQYILQKAAGNIVNLHPLGAISQDIKGKVLAEMLDMHTFGAIAFTDGWKAVQDPNLLLKALEYVKSFNGTVIQIPVDTTLAAGGLMNEGSVSTQLGMAGIPPLAETLIVHRDIELARYTDSKLHITGVSCAGSVAIIRKAKAEGVSVTCSVTPYHLALTDEALQGYDSVYKVSPPLRTEADRQALIAGLKDGTIDCIASHHRPQEWDAKAKEFEYAAEGMNIQEMAFHVIWNAVKSEMPLERFIEAIALAPRKIFNLAPSEIREGKTAQLTIFTIGDSYQPGKENMRSMSRNNPFLDTTFNGKVLGIIGLNKVYLNK